jgi:hypothetical protein
MASVLNWIPGYFRPAAELLPALIGRRVAVGAARNDSTLYSSLENDILPVDDIARLHTQA